MPAYTKAGFTDFVKLYYNHNLNRLEVVMSNGQIMGLSASFNSIGQTNVLDQEVGHLETSKGIGTLMRNCKNKKCLLE